MVTIHFGEDPSRVICGRGVARVDVTHVVSAVTCPDCVRELKEMPTKAARLRAEEMRAQCAVDRATEEFQRISTARVLAERIALQVIRMEMEKGEREPE